MTEQEIKFLKKATIWNEYFKNIYILFRHKKEENDVQTQ